MQATTAKYRPDFPVGGFADLQAARGWAVRFAHWYNHEHRHSGICYVTPAQRHAGQDGPMLAGRHALYQAARESNPRRWSRQTRNWTPIGAVTLNPSSSRQPRRSNDGAQINARRYETRAATPLTLTGAGEARSAVIVLLTWLVSVAGIAHMVAGSVNASYLVLTGQSGAFGYLWLFLTPTLLGNIIGGVTLVAALNYGQVANEVEA